MLAANAARKFEPDDLLDRLRDRTAAFAEGEFQAHQHAVRRLFWIALVPTLMSAIALVLAAYAVFLSHTVLKTQDQILVGLGQQKNGGHLLDQSGLASVVSDIEAGPTDPLPQLEDAGQVNTSAVASLDSPNHIEVDESAAIDDFSPGPVSRESLRSSAVRSEPEAIPLEGRWSASAYHFAIADFACLTDEGVRWYKAGRSYLMPLAVAHAAAKRDLVAHQRPLYWAPPSILVQAKVLTGAEIATADIDLRAFDHHAIEGATPMLKRLRHRDDHRRLDPCL